MNNKKKIIGILLFVCVVFSYYLGKWNGASICRNVSNIQFVEVEEIDDTTYYTGKDVSHYMYSPTRFNEGVIPDASTAAKIAFQWITGSVLMIIFQDRQSINVNETSNELS